jgi:hypothetical protein
LGRGLEIDAAGPCDHENHGRPHDENDEKCEQFHPMTGAPLNKWRRPPAIWLRNSQLNMFQVFSFHF